MAGFFALPRSRFTQAPVLDPIGYKIGLELLVKCRCRRVVEVPIHFRNRLHGESKLSLREQVTTCGIWEAVSLPAAGGRPARSRGRGGTRREARLARSAAHLLQSLA